MMRRVAVLLVAVAALVTAFIVIWQRVPSGVDEIASRHATGDPTLATAVDGRRHDPTASAARSTSESVAAVLGRVLRADGRPYDGARVRLMGHAGALEATSAVAGTFTLEPAPVGANLELVVSAPGHASVVLEVDALASGERRRLDDIVLGGGRALRGRVIDLGGKPIAGAFVALAAHQAFASRADIDYFRIFDAVFADHRMVSDTVTDAAGAFAFSRVASGDWVVAVHAEGFQARFSAPFEVTPDAETPDLTVPLSRSASLRGQVVDSTGIGIADATVAALERGAPFSYVAKTLKAVSEADGRFTIESVGAGEYLVYVRTPSGGVAAAQSVRAGEALVLQVRHAVTVTGRVHDVVTGEGLENIDLAVISGASVAFVRGKSGAGGAFRLENVEAGGGATLLARHPCYVIHPAADAPRPRYTGGLALDALGPPGTEIVFDVPMSAGGTVSGTVRDMKGGAPIAGARVRFVVPRRLIGTSSRPGWRASTDTEGLFVLTGVPFGPVPLMATAPGRAPAMLTTPPELVTGGSLVGLEIWLGEGVVIEGVVTDDRGAPVSGARVHWSASGDEWSRQALSDESGTGSTTKDGRFRLDGVSAAADISVTIRGPAGHGSTERLITTFLPPAFQRIVLARPAAVRGLLTDAAGRVMAGVRMAWIPTGRDRDERAWATNHDQRTLVTDPDGRFLGEGLEPGAGRFMLDPTDSRSLDAASSEEVLLLAGHLRAITLLLE